jgi:hypothetical protein
VAAEPKKRVLIAGAGGIIGTVLRRAWRDKHGTSETRGRSGAWTAPAKFWATTDRIAAPD